MSLVHVYAAAVACLLLTPAGSVMASPLAKDAPLLAKKAPAKKTGKKKKKAAEEEGESFGPEEVEAIDDNDQGMGVHREQEGVDVPYIAEISGLTDISSLTTKHGDADPIATTTVSIAGQWLFILGQMEIGPDLEIAYVKSSLTRTTEDVDDNVIDSETIDTTDQSITIGGLFKYNFGKLDKDLTVPFVYGGVGYHTNEEKAGDDDAETSTGTQFKLGGGVNMFVDSNVAFVPRVEYRMISDTQAAKGDEDAVKTDTSGFKLLFGIGVFI